MSDLDDDVRSLLAEARRQATPTFERKARVRSALLAVAGTASTAAGAGAAAGMSVWSKGWAVLFVAGVAGVIAIGALTDPHESEHRRSTPASGEASRIPEGRRAELPHVAPPAQSVEDSTAEAVAPPPTGPRRASRPSHRRARSTPAAVFHAPIGSAPVGSAPGSAGEEPAVPDPLASEDSLQAEARLIAGALEALRRGDLESSRRSLDEHARRFPEGRLAQERERARARLDREWARSPR